VRVTSSSRASRSAAGRAPDREQQVLQRGPLLGVEAADRAEVDQGQAAVGEQQDIARMRVGVEHAALGDLVHHAAQQRAGQPGPVEPRARRSAARLRAG
jgi:hypothetical protein